MTIEEEIFKRAKIDFAKLCKYGFKKNNLLYKYSQNIMHNTFRIDIEINNAGIVKGKIFDLSFEDEYTNFRIEDNRGSFQNKVRDEFINLLQDIKDKCSTREVFIYEQTNRIAKAITQKYGDEPEFEWEKFPGYATFKNNNKWYSIIMNLNFNKLGENSSKEVEIINLKLDPTTIENFLKQKGFYPAYHMNKKHWLTIILNDTISDAKIMQLIAQSYSYTISKKIKQNSKKCDRL